MNRRPPHCRIFWFLLCFWGLCEIFYAQIPLFPFFGVFSKLFLYRPFFRIEKQVTLDFCYLTTNFFHIDPSQTKQELFSQIPLFTPSLLRALINLSMIKEGFLRFTKESERSGSGSRNKLIPFGRS